MSHSLEKFSLFSLDGSIKTHLRPNVTPLNFKGKKKNKNLKKLVILEKNLDINQENDINSINSQSA